MSEPLDNRVAHLEYRVDGHDKDLTTIKGDSKIMSDSLKAIKDSLNQIKWIAAGAVATYLFQTKGGVDILWKLLL